MQWQKAITGIDPVWLHSAVLTNKEVGVVFGGIRNGGALNELFEYQPGNL